MECIDELLKRVGKFKHMVNYDSRVRVCVLVEAHNGRVIVVREAPAVSEV